MMYGSRMCVRYDWRERQIKGAEEERHVVNAYIVKRESRSRYSWFKYERDCARFLGCRMLEIAVAFFVKGTFVFCGLEMIGWREN
jgi:hypothetical protein